MEWFAKRSIGDLPMRAAERWPERDALSFKGRVWSFAGFADEVEAAARGLIAAGVAPGDKVALFMSNRPEFLFAFFAAIRIGAVAVPVNTRWRSRDLAAGLKRSDTVMLIADTVSGTVDFEALIGAALDPVPQGTNGEIRSAACPTLRRIVYTTPPRAGTAQDWAGLIAAGQTVPPEEVTRRAAAVDPDGMALIIFTSGTTGTPKGVMLGHIAIRSAMDRASILGLTQTDVQINYLPLFHNYALAFVVLQCLLSGAKQVLLDSFDPDEALRLIEAERVTVLHGFDTHFGDLLDALERAGGRYDMSSLRTGTLVVGSETGRPKALEAQKKFCPTVSSYGQSETWSGITCGSPGGTEEQACYGSGYPLRDVELRIADPETGAPLPEGEIGEIQVRTYTAMLGYYKEPEATRAAFTGDGWLRTGDAGYLRHDGHLRFTGRYKDMLRVGGENVDPAEVEALLLEVPGVADVSVVGCSDARLGETAAAFVVPRGGADPAALRLDIEAHCASRIASFKRPRRIEFVERFPCNASGKIDKLVLRQQLSADRPAFQEDITR